MKTTTILVMVTAAALSACAVNEGDELAMDTHGLVAHAARLEMRAVSVRRDFGALDACALRGSVQRALRVSPGGTAHELRVWPSAAEWIENGFFNPTAGDPNDPEFVEMQADQLEDTNFGMTWRLDLPDGAVLDDVLVRTRTGGLPSSVLVGVYRVDRDTGIAEWFASTAGGRGSFATVYSEPCALRLVDFRAQLTAPIALEGADNARFVYFATIIAIGGSAGAQVHGVAFSWEIP